MINEHESKEVIMLAFRAIKFGKAEFLKAVQAYLKYRQNAPPQHGKVKLNCELFSRVTLNGCKTYLALIYSGFQKYNRLQIQCNRYTESCKVRLS